MRKRTSKIKARGAEIVGNGAMLKVLLSSLGLVMAGFIFVFMIA